MIVRLIVDGSVASILLVACIIIQRSIISASSHSNYFSAFSVRSGLFGVSVCPADASVSIFVGVIHGYVWLEDDSGFA